MTDGFAYPTPFIKGYVEGKYRIHVHVRCADQVMPRLEVGPNEAEWCAVFKWPKRSALDNVVGNRAWEAIRAEAQRIVQGDIALGEIDVAMLVPVPELLEYRERLPERVVWPRVERLQPLEVCMERGDTPKRLNASPSGPVGGIDDDWELDSAPFVPSGDGFGGGRAGVAAAELPDEIVESGANVVDDIANDRSPLIQGRLADHATHNWDTRSLEVQIGHRLIRAAFKERPYPCLQVFQMFASTAEFGDRVADVGHG